LINQYRTGRLPIFHIDLYRLETADAILSAGLEEFFQQTEGITLIEWFERLESTGLANIATQIIHFEVTADTERKITDENSRA
jgi:tRNA threonylcarbamoyladenosine biosynthesis protein TsaE